MIEHADKRADELIAALDEFARGETSECGLPTWKGADLREIVYRWLYSNNVAFSLELRTGDRVPLGPPA